MKRNDFLTGPRRGRNRTIIAMVVVAVLLGAAALLARGGQRSAEVTSPLAGGRSSGPGVGGSPVPGGGPAGALPSPLRLVGGARLVNGVAVGYPHTLVGAVSAAVEYTTQAGSTFDLARTAEIAQAITDSSYGDARAFYVRGAVNVRRHLGLPLGGPVPPGASQTFGPMAYQVRQPSTDDVTVLLLSYLTFTTPSRGMEQRLIVLPARMVWHHGDWKVAKRPEGAPDYLELLHQPGSAQAQAAGWQDFLQ